MAKTPKPRQNSSDLTKSITFYLPRHVYELYRDQARSQRLTLSAHIANLVKKGADDHTPYYTHASAMYSMMAAFLVLRQIQWSEANNPERYDDIYHACEIMMNDFIGPMPRIPDAIMTDLRAHPTGLVKEVAEALHKHLKK